MVVAECLETEGEFSMLSLLGIRPMQGFLFARPALVSSPTVSWPVNINSSSY